MQQQYAALLRAQAEYVRALGEIAAEGERQTTGEEPFDLETASAMNAQWLLAKFDAFWFKTADLEEYIRETWTDIPCFSSLDFELLIKHLLYLLEERVYSITKKSHDEGIDLVFEEQIDLNYYAYSKRIVQCKLYRGYVPVTDIRDFFGVMVAQVATGLFFTTGILTSQAEKFIPIANSSPAANRFHLIARNEMVQFLNIGRQLVARILDLTPDGYDADASESINTLRHEAVALIQTIRPSEAQKELF